MTSSSGSTRTTLAAGTCSDTTSHYSFEGFLHGWHHQQDQLLEEITAAMANDNDNNKDEEDEVAKELIARALAHFENYYVHKSRAAQHNVFSLFSPPWCSSLECAFMWVAGFRPAILLQLVSDSIHNLTASQIQAIHRLKRRTKVEEKHIGNELAKVQEKVAAPPIIHGLRVGGGGYRDGEEEGVFNRSRKEAVEELEVGLEEVVSNADTLRVSTVEDVAQILIPAQGLRFLAAALRLQHRIRISLFQTHSTSTTTTTHSPSTHHY